MRLIDADALKASIEEKDRYNLGGECRIIVCGMLDDAPTIDAEPVKCGRWERRNGDYGESLYCTECGGAVIYDICESEAITPYCYHCGARMDGENE